MKHLLVTLFCLIPIFGLLAQTNSKTKPNIVFLLVDDMGYGECGFNGGKIIKTPVIDQLAVGGAILENNYVQPVCSPTRSCLLTGRYPTHTGVYGIIAPGAVGLPLNERTLATALKEAGYTTAILGKWHLGETDKQYQPNARGFDYQYGHFFGNIDYFSHARNEVPDWYRNGVPIKEEGYSTQLIAKEACKLIETNDQKKPFFLYVPFNGIHAPFQVPDAYLKAYPNLSGNRQKLAGMLAAVDEAIGQILQSLEKSGMRENTLIVFSSDNGAPQPGDNTPLRDYKATVYEGGIRAASFVNWPGKVAAQQRIKEPMHTVDWYPTLIGLAGGSLKQKLPIDGLDVWPMITQQKTSPHDAILSVSNRGTSLVAIRMGNWKLIVLDMTGIAVGSKISNRYEPVALFNLADDPSEKKNLAAEHPEKVTMLQAKLKQLLAGAVPSITKENAVE